MRRVNTVRVFSNASLALILLVAAAAVMESSWQLASLLALLSLDALFDVARYVGGSNQRGFLAFLLELLSAGASVTVMLIAMLYLSYSYIPLALLLITLASLDAAVSIQEAFEALSATAPIASDYLE